MLINKFVVVKRVRAGWMKKIGVRRSWQREEAERKNIKGENGNLICFKIKYTIYQQW